MDAYQKLFDTFDKQDDGSFLYPKDYAGAYIEGDKLIIMLTSVNEQSIANYNAIYPEYISTVIYQEAKYALNQLCEIQQIGHELLEDFSIASYGVDEKNNETFIQVPEEEMEDLTQTIKKMRFSVPITIERSVGENVTTVAIPLEGGMAISNSIGTFSICIGGTYAGKNAILTCGHDFKANKPVNLGSASLAAPMIGTTTYVRCNPYATANPGKNALGDFSIVLLNSSYQPTNKMKSENSTVYATGTYSSVPVGTSIYKYGQKSKYSYGTVSRTNITVVYKNGAGLNTYEVSGITQSYMQNSSGTNAVETGDSGGCVYTKSGSNYMISGTVSGATVIDGMSIIHVMYSSPIYYAIDQGFTPKLNNASD